jgi:hypothetical protein
MTVTISSLSLCLNCNTNYGHFISLFTAVVISISITYKINYSLTVLPNKKPKQDVINTIVLQRVNILDSVVSSVSDTSDSACSINMFTTLFWFQHILLTNINILVSK